MKQSGNTLAFYVTSAVIAVVLVFLLVRCRLEPTAIAAAPMDHGKAGRIALVASAAQRRVESTVAAKPENRPNQAASPSTVPRQTVVIRDGKTVDFTGGKPTIRDSAKEKAIIDAAVREMDAAARSVTFAPRPAAQSKK